MNTKIKKASFVFALTIILGYSTGLVLETATARDSKLSTLVETGKFDNRWIPFSKVLGLENIDFSSFGTSNGSYSIFFKDAYLEITPIDAFVQFVISADKKTTPEGDAFFVNRITQCIVEIAEDIPDAECIICALQDDDDTFLALGQDPISGITAGDQFTISWDEFLNDDEYITDVKNVDGVLVGVCVPSDGGQGCTPGFWKQSQHFEFWTAPYQPSSDFRDVFGIPTSFDFDLKLKGKNTDPQNPTLLEALKAKGGQQNALVRHAVAALLNAASSEVSYLFSVAQVIDGLKNGFGEVDGGLLGGNFEATKAVFEAENELGCPVRSECECSKPTIFTVLYSGPTPDLIEIFDKNNVLLGTTTLNPDNTIVVNSLNFNPPSNTVKSETNFKITNGADSIILSYHTSCSQLLFVGDQRIGSLGGQAVSLTVVSGTDSQGNPTVPDATCQQIPTPSCDCTKPSIFTVKYISNGALPDSVQIFKNIKDSKKNPTPTPLFTTNVNGDGNIVINSQTDLGKSTLESNTHYRIIRGNDVLDLAFHTSCSKPLFVGDTRMGMLGSDEVILEVVSGTDLLGNPTIPDGDTCTINDETSGHSESGGVDSLSTPIQAITPYEKKKTALDNLISLQGLESNPSTTIELTGAITQIQSSIIENYWIDDYHLDISTGEFVLSHSIQAVDHLMIITTLSDETQTFKNSIQNIIDLLVMADIELAQTAIDDVTECDGKTPKVGKHISKAQQKLSDALADQNLEKYSDAILKLYDSWFEAFLATEACPSGYWTQFEGYLVVP